MGVQVRSVLLKWVQISFGETSQASKSMNFKLNNVMCPFFFRHRVPKEQWWLEMRSLQKILAKYQQHFDYHREDDLSPLP